MNLREALTLIDELALDNNLSKPYIVGGFLRDIELGDISRFSDVDITTGDSDGLKLAKLFAEEVGSKTEKLGSGSLKVPMGKVSFDFSNGKKYLNVVEHSNGTDDLTIEIHSRDFTVNCLTSPMDLSKINDITGSGKDDIKNRILTCPVPCDISISNDPSRILRAVYIYLKYDFEMSDDLVKAIKGNSDLLNSINRRYASTLVNKCLRESEDAIDLFFELGIAGKIPMTKMLTKKLLNSRRMFEALDD